MPALTLLPCSGLVPPAQASCFTVLPISGSIWLHLVSLPPLPEIGLLGLQAQTLNFLLDGFNLVGRARTGCGKTLAFVLPIVERLGQNPNRQHGRAPRVIVLAPTRELAKQASS